MISVLIPTLNDEARLGRALSPLVGAAVEGLVREVIVIDGGSTDATLDIADDAGCTILQGEGSAAVRLAQGAAGARSPWLLLLDPDAWLSPGWEGPVRDHFEAGREDSVSFPPAPEGLMARLGLGPPGPRALLISRRAFGAGEGLAQARPRRLPVALAPKAPK